MEAKEADFNLLPNLGLQEGIWWGRFCKNRIKQSKRSAAPIKAHSTF